MQHQKGSLWRKWDLHLHTPTSYDYKGSGVTNATIVDHLVDSEIRVAAITDHNVMDVSRINTLRDLGNGKLTILPGIELCSELGGSTSVHFIGVFPEECDVDYVWDQLRVKLELSKADIKRRGGHQKIYTDLKEAAAIIHSNSGVVSIHAGKKSNSLENISSRLLFKQAVKTELLRKFVDILEIGAISDITIYDEIIFPAIGKRLPLVICSDNHDISAYKFKADSWIKADPSFYGLLHVLSEPLDRIFIGEKPEKRKVVSANKTKYINSIRIGKKEGSKLKEIWFDDAKLDLNHDLVAIIGNKGSGKSALAEVIGLLGNTHTDKNFSFLSKDRFRTPSGNRAEHFEAELFWASGDVDHIGLDNTSNYHHQEKIKCIPQGLFEVICNDIARGADNKFHKELEKVIFSHVSHADRLGKESLEELIDYLTDESSDAVNILKKQLHSINARIAKVQEKLSLEYREALSNVLSNREQELDSHDKTKPSEIERPHDVKKNGQNRVVERITKEKLKLVNLENMVAQAEAVEKENTAVESEAIRVLEQINNFQEEFRLFRDKSAQRMKQLGIEFDDIIELRVDLDPITSIKNSATNKKNEAQTLLDPMADDASINQLESVSTNIEELQKRLDEPQRQYEIYLDALKEWEEQRKEIIGSSDKPGTMAYYEEQLRSLDTLPDELSELEVQRKKITQNIYDRIQELVKTYRELYAPAKEFTGMYNIGSDSLEIKFDVSIVDVSLESRIFDWIARNVSGSFYGPDGPKVLRKIAERHHFSDWTDVSSFLDNLMDYLTSDKRDSISSMPIRITDLLRKGRDIISFYDYIFSLDYLKPRYVLKWDDKEVGLLSPGERGTLLLIFYLLVDTDDIPLVIDQPEENLDNQTVYRMLVDAIKATKKNRQLIVVTLNPNLAVVCDAEQIICCSIDKENGNRIDYASGAIENPAINRKIVDILEGTKPALDNRWYKYEPFQKF